MKEFWKSVNIWRSYGQEFSVLFFLRHSVVSYLISNLCCTHTHPFNGPFSGTTQVSRYQKSITNLDFTEARDSEWQWHQLGEIWILLKQETVSGSGISWVRCKSAPCSRQITTPASHHSVFYRPDALPVAQPTASKHWRQSMLHTMEFNYQSVDILLQIFIYCWDTHWLSERKCTGLVYESPCHLFTEVIFQNKWKKTDGTV